MTPGSLLLGNAGECFSCAHEHGVGDRCVAFFYEAEWWERIVSGAGAAHNRFRTARIPPIRELARVAVQSLALQSGDWSVPGDELSVELAAAAVQMANGDAVAQSMDASAGAMSRVTRVIRMIENEPDAPQRLDELARCARLSPYHFLRCFRE